MSHVAKSASFACDINKFSAGAGGSLGLLIVVQSLYCNNILQFTA